MRNLYVPEIERFRDKSEHVLRHFGSYGNEYAGRFHVMLGLVPTPLTVIAASDEGWDHVSVSAPGRCPTWNEMEAVKRLFFMDDECAMQLHVPPADHINVNPYVLHLWRPHEGAIPRPPGWMVG